MADASSTSISARLVDGLGLRPPINLIMFTSSRDVFLLSEVFAHGDRASLVITLMRSSEIVHVLSLFALSLILLDVFRLWHLLDEECFLISLRASL